MKLLLSALLACCMTASFAAGEIRFAPEKDYGPFVYQTAEGRVEGLSIDILDAVKSGLDAPVLMLPAQPLAAILEAARERAQDSLFSKEFTERFRGKHDAFLRKYTELRQLLVSSR